jgi:hypothetical protein
MHHNEWVHVKPNSVVPFWPNQYKLNEKRYVVMRKDKSVSSTKPFWFNSKHSSALILSSEVILSITKTFKLSVGVGMTC